ncbi:lanthionine synthetase C family protein [Streptomyces erythrochromogenes]|uniref:lanthionine synthetase C family protein n=1 Tax=Streptomyces erythrochromogenes TaxID=285574 RepID=UPI0038709B08|nr:lanthionine synthetase C family protein [Streptomyces erythrochromogenes]
MNAATVLDTRFGPRLAAPDPAGDTALGQSLVAGAAGVALWHIERALTGAGTWEQAGAWLTEATRAEVTAADTACLSYGAPGLAFVLHTAAADGHDRYRTALDRLDAATAALAHRRTEAAHARIRRGELPAFAEYDLLHGLTGIGVHLLHHTPGSDALAAVLTYLVALTRPLTVRDETLPGWWCAHDPHRFYTPGGHGNFGMAHGITGPLALLAQAQRRGVAVDGQREAIATITAWFDQWRQDGASGPWWPETITREEAAAGRPTATGPWRPSWCYGTPGIARTLQLAAIATADTRRQEAAEHALLACLADPRQLAKVTDPGVCHGAAGLFQTVWRAARDARTPGLAVAVRHLADTFTGQHAPEDTGFLEGAAGQALAQATALYDRPPASGWDACLLIT